MRLWLGAPAVSSLLLLWVASPWSIGEPPVRAQSTGSPSVSAVGSSAARSNLIEASPEARSYGSSCGFMGRPEGAARRSLALAAIADVENGRGGRSVAFKILLADGTVGYFKPEQSFSAAHWYSELAAYHLDRELGLGRVPPTIGRRFDWAPLRAVARHDRHLDEVVVQEDGTVRGAFVWWVPGGLDALRMGRGWERWIRVQRHGPYVNPFVRPRDYRAQRRGEEVTIDGSDRPRADTPDRPGRPAELSDLIVFDFLTQNVDRWGGDFTNVRTREDGALIFLDNGAGFWPGDQRNGIVEARLHALQRFRRSTVEALRRFDRDRYERRLAADPLAPILNEHQLDGLEERVGAVLEHVEAMRARFGDDEVLRW